MDADMLKKNGGFILDVNSNLYKNLEHAISRIISGEKDKLQEVYDVFYGKESIRNAFLDYKNSDCAAKVENEADLQQLYIKGVVDGMRSYHTFMIVYGRSTHDKRFDFMKEDEANA